MRLTCICLGGHADAAGAGRAALDSIRARIILADAHARTIQVNAAAQRLLDRVDGFAIGRGGSLVAASREATNRLRGLIRSAGNPDPRGRMPGGGSIRLPRPSGMAPLEVLVSLLRATPFAGSFSLGARASVMLCVVDPDAGVEIEAAGLRQLYGLTAAEARLALMLLAGHDLPAAALAFGISVHTARTLLKRSFERVGVHR